MDRSLLPVLVAESQPHAGLIHSPQCPNASCENCAVAAITSNWRWKPAPFDGTGMMDGEPEVQGFQ